MSGGPPISFSAAGLPAIPGLAIRAWRDAADFAPMAEVRNADLLADGLDETVTGEVLANELLHDPRLDSTRDLTLVELDGRTVGYAVRSRWVEEPSGDAILFHRCFLDPIVHRRGLGRALLRANEALLAGDPIAPAAGRPRTHETWADDRAAAARALYAGEGYAPVRWFFLMLRRGLDGLPEVALPEGLTVRPVVGREDAVPVLHADDEAFRDHWGYTPLQADDIDGYLGDPRQDLTLWQVAYDGAEVAGSVLPLVDAADNERFGRRRGWLDSVSTRRPWRRRGLARALIARALVALREQGLDEAILGVDASNPTGALDLYESVGFKLHRRSAVYRKPAPPASPAPAAAGPDVAEASG